MVSENGTEMDKKKTEAITNWPIPVTVTDITSIQGFTIFYRQFIPKYAHIVRLLSLLMSSEDTSKKKRMVVWNDKCLQAFNTLKE